MNSFTDLGLSASTTEAVRQLGFEQPMPIQDQAIPLLLNKQTDLVALAQTGTGKTAAFGLPLVERIERSLDLPQALILAPTRELCIQITRDIKDFADRAQHINTLAVYGGSSIGKQIKALKRGVQIIAATPGRLLDLLNRGKIDTSAISTVVLDEADELLNMGFQKDLNAIFDTLPKHYNTWLFSATMPKSVARIAKRYMNNPEHITVGTKNAGAENVTHQYAHTTNHKRYDDLKRLIAVHPNMYAIVFCRTRRNTRKVAERLTRDGIRADAIHGDLSQSQRDRVMSKFRNKRITIMVATDVASRGIDVNDLTHVINYELPDDPESYTHRSGRTGRASKEGIAISLATKGDKKKIRKIERIIKQKFDRIALPTALEVRKKKVRNWADSVLEANTEAVEDVAPALYNEFEDLSRKELIQKFAALWIDDATGATAGNGSQDARQNDDYQTVKNGSESGFERFFINIGRKDKLSPGALISLISKQCRNGDINIGKIDILGSFSFFEADINFATEILASFKREVNYNGRSVQVDVAKPKK